MAAKIDQATLAGALRAAVRPLSAKDLKRALVKAHPEYKGVPVSEINRTLYEGSQAGGLFARATPEDGSAPLWTARTHRTYNVRYPDGRVEPCALRIPAGDARDLYSVLGVDQLEVPLFAFCTAAEAKNLQASGIDIEICTPAAPAPAEPLIDRARARRPAKVPAEMRLKKVLARGLAPIEIPPEAPEEEPEVGEEIE